MHRIVCTKRCDQLLGWGDVENFRLGHLFWICAHVVIVQINAHSKLAVYFLRFNIVFVILKLFAFNSK